MSRNLTILAVVAIVLVGGVVLFAGQQGKQTETPSPTQIQEQLSPTEVMEKEDASPEAGMEKNAVEIKNFAFGPKTITIKKGTKVAWTNQDSVSHTATADDGSFDTGLLAKGESGSVTFDKVGTFSYHCTPHPNMKAAIIVE